MLVISKVFRRTPLNATFTRLLRNRAGNIAMTFAIISVPLMGAMGAGIDYARAMNHRRELQSNLDAALVAAVKDIGTKNETQLKAQIANWMAADASTKGGYTLDAKNIAIDNTGQIIGATVTASVDTTFMRILGYQTIPVAVKASVMGGETVSKSAFSMYLVLDKSLSMSYDTDSKYSYKCGTKTCTGTYSKIESLVIAVNTLVDQFETADPEDKYVRVGAVSYNHEKQKETPLVWGGTSAKSYAAKLKPEGLTNSSGAMLVAYQALQPTTGKDSEDVIHKNKNGLTPEKYIIFMTDGDNTKQVGRNIVSNPEADASTRATCASAKAAGIKIYTIAFMAPDNGKKLLNYCSSGTGYYYEPNDMSTLVASFGEIARKAAKTGTRLTN